MIFEHDLMLFNDLQKILRLLIAIVTLNKVFYKIFTNNQYVIGFFVVKRDVMLFFVSNVTTINVIQSPFRTV
jgi:hypothetical protein